VPRKPNQVPSEQGSPAGFDAQVTSIVDEGDVPARFRLLGPLEARIGVRQAPLGGPKARGLLALLALRVNEVVPTDLIVDTLWLAEPPKTATRQVQDLVSQLRRAMMPRGPAGRQAGELVTTHPGGYALRADPAGVDVCQFRALLTAGRLKLRQGQPRAAGAEFRNALRLWRGEALLGIGLPAIQRQAQRLNEERLGAYEAWIDCETAVGGGPALAGQLRVLVDDYPLREAFRRQLMVVLHQSGRRAEALEVYQAGRELLVRELGIEPGTALRETQREILAEDEPSPAPPQAWAAWRLPRQLPPDLLDFTGRGPELRALAALLGLPGTEAQLGRARAAIIRGGAGMGKTSLAVHAAHGAASHFPDGQLFCDLRGISGAPARPDEVLGGFLRDLGLRPPEIPDGTAPRTALFRTLLSDQRVLILLDDAGEDTQLLPILPSVPGCAVLITSRRRIDLGGHALHIDLRPFTSAESLDLLSRVLGSGRVDAEQRAATELADECDRLPLAVRATAGRLAGRPGWRIADMTARVKARSLLDELTMGAWSLSDSFERSYRALPTDQRRAFRMLGRLQEREFPVSSASSLLAASPDATERVLEGLVDNHLLVSTRYGTYAVSRLLKRFAQERLALEPDESA
jgi:DNA-binding SARP family transcriptional activator